MYHTEGFVNKYTMNMDEHIIMLALEEQGRPWYLWCVVKKAVANTEVLRQVLSFWLKQTLLTKGCKGRVSTQRELNRLGGYLQNMECANGVLEDVQLFMYYQGEFYGWDSTSLTGICFSDDEEGKKEQQYKEIASGVYGYVSEDTLWEQYCCRDNKGGNLEAEKLANEWELSLLKACSTGDIQEGFFLIWEDKGAL